MGAVQQRDYGFFGPDSVTWRVWGYPTSILLGFLRAVVVEELDPYLVASVEQSGQVKARPKLRYDRTMQYFATIGFGDAESAVRAADTLMKIHARAVGHDPVTGNRFDANDPGSQLWIHLTAWHSILYTYEVFGPGKLSAADEARYWEECARAAAFQTIDPADVPRSREGVRAYFAAYRPRLVGSEVAQDMMDFLLNSSTTVLPDGMPRPLAAVVNAVARRAIIATMPRWMRKLGATTQSPLTDRIAIALTRPVVRGAARSRRLELWALRLASPRTAPILEPVLYRRAPIHPVVRDPAEAHAAYGVVEPRAQYTALLEARARQAGPSPYPRHHGEPLLSFTG